MSDTPRTDAETYVWEKGRENPFVHKEFAQQLERELSASLENQVKAMETLVEQQDFTLKSAVLLSKAVSQRDRAIEIAGLALWNLTHARHSDSTMLSKELDELKAEIK
jgi:hypothetical protein